MKQFDPFPKVSCKYGAPLFLKNSPHCAAEIQAVNTLIARVEGEEVAA